MGGGFGYKGKHYPEETIVAWAARRLRRPVQVGRRRGASSFLSDTQGGTTARAAELALDARRTLPRPARRHRREPRRLCLDFRRRDPRAPIYSALLAGVYRTPAIHVEVTGVFTNTVPTDAYRGAGRPEACYVLERLADEAARKLGIDRAEIRRRNLIPKEAMPYRTPIGPTYDCGDFPRVLRARARARRLRGFRAAQARRRRRSCARHRPRVLCRILRRRAVAPRRHDGRARRLLRVGGDPRRARRQRARRYLGTHNHGQGHATTFAQILADAARRPARRDRDRRGRHRRGARTAPGRSARARSRSAARRSTARPRRSSPRARGSRRTCSKRRRPTSSSRTAHSASPAPTGASASPRWRAPPTCRTTIRSRSSSRDSTRTRSTTRRTSPSRNGAHVCEVEVDPETGDVRRGRLPGGGRRRHGDQPDDRRGPGPRRPGAGHRPGAGGAHGLRRSGQLLSARSWTTRCRAPTTCRASSPETGRDASRAPTTRWARRAAANRATIGAPRRGGERGARRAGAAGGRRPRNAGYAPARMAGDNACPKGRQAIMRK